MSVSVDGSGRRWVRAEVETPGTVEEVWRAISTDAGLSSWFTRSEFEMGADGQPTRLLVHFGLGMDSAAAITEWNAPHGFAVTSDEFIRDGPEVATVWRIEEGEGESCVVSVEHSLFEDSDAYDAHIEATEAGWPAFFRILQLYMTLYRGQPCTLMELIGPTSAGSQLWENLSTALGFAGAAPGERFAAPEGGMDFAGEVYSTPDETEIILHIDEPTRGAVHLFVWTADEESLLSVRFYLYGEEAAEVVSREEPRWRSWMEEQFPSFKV